MSRGSCSYTTAKADFMDMASLSNRACQDKAKELRDGSTISRLFFCSATNIAALLHGNIRRAPMGQCAFAGHGTVRRTGHLVERVSQHNGTSLRYRWNRISSYSAGSGSATSAPASGAVTPRLTNTFSFSSATRSGFWRRNCRTFSRPWPSRVSP